jgi:hypothetical protein
MRKFTISSAFLIVLSVSTVIAASEVSQSSNSNSPTTNSNDNNIIHKVCLFHGRAYQVIPFGEGECDFIINGRPHETHNGIVLPGDPECFSEYIRIRRRH